ncbi:DUF2306 domain-containing protein [Rhizobium laguerreae]|uniref:DUF2306 domain-containing protein n=1 Tax=Rhizobium laguerreae TaxID=1076926 RepID=A0A7Y2R6I6_9HYPH|nr:DUF2306 domain-containing protein [Rhizobium laguerreae]NDK49919.1 DUF2306 domain-containing protein [Rhizobium laguerreae]NNH65152.1 DUF2306 domain-containing protein [Rhizobium laguerreae]
MAETGIEFNRMSLMTLEPLLDAPFAVQIHVAAVTPAALLGAYILLRPKGTPLHRLLGRIWMALMIVTAMSSFFIHELDLFYGFSPIHLLSIATLFGSWNAIAAARRGDIRLHKRIVTGLYFGGIVLAGLFTFLPGRIMHTVIFTGAEWPAVLAAAVTGSILIAIVLRRRRERLIAR